jgi:LCP family protein required for cell wall assembly
VLAGRDTEAAREEALRALSDAVSTFLGVPIDCFVGVAIDDFEAMIDRIGGVPMTLEQEISYRDEESGETVRLPRGPRLLDGREAAAFVRYRMGYARGDLGRIDAQKAFISALFQKFGSGLSLRSMFAILSELRGSTVTDLPLSLALRCGLRFIRSCHRTDIRYLTLPGEPCMHNGVSYYVANRACSEEAITNWIAFSDTSVTFDRNAKLLLPTDAKMCEIYRRSSVPYRVYTDAELRPARDS